MSEFRTEWAIADRGDIKRAAQGAIDLTDVEASHYSVGAELARQLSLRGLLSESDRKRRQASIEREISTSMLKTRPEGPGGIGPDATVGVPARVVAMRAMATQPGGKGGYLTGVETLDVIGALRPTARVVQAGARSVLVASGTSTIPNVGTGLSASWADEAGSVSATDPALVGQLSIVPRRCSVITDMSLQLLTQQPRSFDALVFPDMLAAIGAALDQAAIQGSGGLQPLGITNTGGVGAQSGTSLAWAGIQNMRETIATANANDAATAWIAAPTLRETLAQRERISTSGRFIWEGDEIEARPAYVTTNCPAATLICGDFTRLVVVSFFSGIEVDTSEGGTTRFNPALVGVRATLWCDVVVAKPAAFIVSPSIT